MKYLFFKILINVSIILLSSALEKHPYGQAIPFQFGENSEEISDSVYDNLKEIFGLPEVENRKVVILSIIGAYRKGKSFFLNYCLRFLYANYRSVNTLNQTFIKKDNWWGSDDEPLLGFSWKHGSEPDTKGILFWSDVFLHEQNGEKIAIYIIDTQGLFESGRDSSLDAKIFGITNLISSIQTFNIKDVKQEDQLELLKKVTKFTKLTSQRQKNQYLQSNSKPFQNLLFLFRDWHDEDYDFGYEGGQIYLKKHLYTKKQSNKSGKSQNVRENIMGSYDNINAFLLPSPGNKVHRKTFDGRWGLLDDEFREYLKSIIESIFLPQSLVKKKIFGEEVTANELISYTLTLFAAFQRSELPDDQFVFDITVKNRLMKLSDQAIDTYMNKIMERTDHTSPNFHSNLLNDHARIKLEVIENFKNQSKIADEVTINEFLEHMRNRIDEKFNNWDKITLDLNKRFIENKIHMEQVVIRQKQEYARQLEQEKHNHEMRILGIKNYRKTPNFFFCKMFTFGIHHCGLKHM